MAAKRIAQTAIDWASLAERVPSHQRAQFAVFKAKSDEYLRRVLQLPERPPAIDWKSYKATIPVAGMVDDFHKKYCSLAVPYPPDKVSSEIDSMEKDAVAEIEKFKSESDARIEEYKQKLAYLAAMIPYDQMTMEDFRDTFPDDALDPINKPTFWPHTPEEQIGYEEKHPQPGGGH